MSSWSPFHAAGWLGLFVNDECVEHGSAERAIPVTKLVIVLSLRDPLDFEHVAADFAFMHGLAPLFKKEKGDSVIESPSMVYDRSFC